MPTKKQNGDSGSKRPKPPLAERLKRVAQGSGFTSEAISERLGLTAGAVRNWWVGKNEPSVEMLVRYASLTGVSVNYLLTGETGVEKPQVVEAVRALLNFQALPAHLVQTPPGLIKIANTLPQRAQLQKKIAAILDQVQKDYGRSWGELTEEEQARVASHLADTLTQNDAQPGEDAELNS